MTTDTTDHKCPRCGTPLKAALDIAAATCEKSAYAADADGHHFAYSITRHPRHRQ